jgi:uncharacterized membrane protein
MQGSLEVAMPSVMHIVLAVVGALVGANLAAVHSWLFAAAIGACVGLGIAQSVLIARQLARLQAEVDRLRTGPDMPAPALSVPAPMTGEPFSTPEPQTESRGPAIAPEPPIVRWTRRFFSAGNALVRTGVVVLFFGVAFLLRYLAEHTHVPIEFRLTGVALGGLILLALGWRLRTRRPGYALALQGGAVGILYLTVFAAMRLYSLLSPATAFPLLVMLAAASATLAILQDSQAFALLAVIGGFLAPILASSGQGNHVVLFTYYALLNAAIMGTAWFKAWRALNLAGFLSTFVIATLWGSLRYRPADFATTEPFLVLFFLMYVAIAILFAQRQPPELRSYVDGTLVFGTPIAAFGLQSAMLHGRLLPLAESALAASGIYLAIAWLLIRKKNPTQRLLVEAFLALGVMFLTLAVPLALSGSWDAAIWGLEGAALIWIGCRQDRALARAFGALLQIAAGCTIWMKLGVADGTFRLPDGMYLSGLVLGAASTYAARNLYLSRYRLREYEHSFSDTLFFWGVIWWCISGISELQIQIPDPYLLNAELGYIVLTALLSSELCRRLELPVARVPALLLLPLLVVFAIATLAAGHHPLADGGWILWPLAFAVFYLLAIRHEGAPCGPVANGLHAVSAWLMAVLLSWELEWQVHTAVGATGSWSGIAWAVIPALMLFLIPPLSSGVDWPFRRHRDAYMRIAGSGFALYLGLWSVTANVLMRGNPYPFAYLPLLNPLDLAQMFVLLVLIRYFIILHRDQPRSSQGNERIVFSVTALLVFIALNGALIRALNHLAGVPFSLQSMLHSTLVQTSLSIYWAVLALLTMLVATRRSIRILWITGAVLMAVVLVKLFLVDLSSVGTIERIVSFIGVGVLMLVLGYFSPLPPVAQNHQ